MKRQTQARTYTAQAHEYYEHDDLAKALRLCRKAYALDRNDPRVVWDYGSILRETGHEDKAISVFRRLLSAGAGRLVAVADERDERWARSLQNDCRLMIGLSYFELKRYALARKWLNEYLSHLNPTTPSLYRKSVATDTLGSIKNSRLISQLMVAGHRARAKGLILKELKKRPDDFYWLAQLAYLYYQEDNCNLALKTIREAVKLEPTEPLVMWYHALILRSSGHPKESINLLRKIISKGAKRIGTVETREGLRWGRSLVNDCKYDVALAFMAVGDLKSADKWVKYHIMSRRPGIPSVYTRNSVRSLQREVAKKREFRGHHTWTARDCEGQPSN